MSELLVQALKKAKFGALLSKNQTDWVQKKNKALKGKWTKLHKKSAKNKGCNFPLDYSVIKLKAPTGRYRQFAIYTNESTKKNLLGKGGYGKVKLAQDIKSLEWVALKIVHNNNNVAVERFKGYVNIERAVLQKLHRQKGEVHRVNSTGQEKYYTAMKVYNGSSLTPAALVNASLNERIDIAIQLLNQLQKMHRLGVIHRDVKCGNVLYMSSSGKVKLVDFGLSKISKSKEVHDVYIVGTKEYHPPELHGYRMRLLSQLPKSGPAIRTLYFSKNKNGQLCYLVLNPQGKKVTGTVKIDFNLKLPLTVDILERFKLPILHQTAKENHTQLNHYSPKTDIWSLAKVLEKSVFNNVKLNESSQSSWIQRLKQKIQNRYTHFRIKAIQGLLSSMKQNSPKDRPSVNDLIVKFEGIKSKSYLENVLFSFVSCLERLANFFTREKSKPLKTVVSSPSSSPC